MIHNDPHKSPQSSKFKQLSKQWNNLIKQFKTQSSLKARVDLPPIIFQRKSPLQNYKNAIKLHQSIKRKKTLTQKIIQLSLQNKRKKISTININQQEIKRHKRFNSSEQIYTLSEEERELLSSKQFHYHRSNTLREENSVDKVNTRDIIKQIKAYHQQQIVKDRMKQSLKDNMHIHNNNNKNNNNNKRQKSKTTIIKHIEIQPTQNNNHPDKSLENNYKKQLQQSMKNYINDQEDQQIASLKSRQQDHQTVQVKTRGLSLQISKDCKSLRYRHQRKEQQNSLQKQKGEDSIAKMLIKNRKQKVQHIFSIFSPNKNNTNNNNLNNTNNNNLNNSNNNNLNNTNNNKSNNQSQSQRILKPWGQQQQLSNIQYREHYSQISITQNNKSSIIKSNTNSPTSRTGKVTLFSPINRKRQKHYMKKYTQSNNRQLKVNINALNSKHYQPWNISINDGVSECLDDGGESSVGFNIENYYKANDDMQIDECQSPNSKTVIIM